MTEKEFEEVLDIAVAKLTEDVRGSVTHDDPKVFESFVLQRLRESASQKRITIAPTFNAHAFPDIKANGFGVEVKTSLNDSWLTVGNSVFEGMRDPSVSKIYVVFAKLAGVREVKWGRYEERITHVRISHAPRFVLEVVALIPFRCRAAWWHEAVLGRASEVRCVRKRIRFVRPDGSRGRFTGSCDSCIVVWRGWKGDDTILVAQRAAAAHRGNGA